MRAGAYIGTWYQYKWTNTAYIELSYIAWKIAPLSARPLLRLSLTTQGMRYCTSIMTGNEDTRPFFGVVTVYYLGCSVVLCPGPFVLWTEKLPTLLTCGRRCTMRHLSRQRRDIHFFSRRCVPVNNVGLMDEEVPCLCTPLRCSQRNHL